ncbi:hypothetical protein [Enhygromyxa salina]|uniref:hypothetical protein n=1 Tax=Enhygromyxa salina TaxID=215803 RepID=UPI000D096BC0|nr:hypothetical protein [Enhygromyxa salina]
MDDSTFLCAGSVIDQERFVHYVAEELDVELGRRIPVYVFGNVEGYCPETAAACVTRDGVVFTSPRAAAHELAHAVSCEWRSGSAPAFSEGLAVSFELEPSESLRDPREFVTAGVAADVDYPGAGHFVRWLIEFHGLAAFRELFLTSPRGGGGGVLDVLEAVYGQDAESLFAEYEASAPHLWVPHRQCADLELLEPSAGTWQFDATFDCEDPSTLGPWVRDFFSYADSMYQSFLIEIDTPGTYTFERGMDTELWVERCLDETGLSEAEADSLWRKEPVSPIPGVMDIDLDPGTYRVDVLRKYGPPHQVTLQIRQKP